MAYPKQQIVKQERRNDKIFQNPQGGAVFALDPEIDLVEIRESLLGRSPSYS